MRSRAIVQEQGQAPSSTKLNLVHPVSGFAGDSRLYLIRRGVRAARRSASARDRARKAVRELFQPVAADRDGTLDGDAAAEALLTVTWFNRHPKERERAQTPRSGWRGGSEEGRIRLRGLPCETGVSGSGALLFAALATVGLGACGASGLGYPTPRRLVVHSGERIAPTAERMEAVEEWVREQVDSIREDPSFLIIDREQSAPAYPWETLELNAGGDTARIWHQAGTGTYGPFLIYAHLHLMDAQNRLDRWLPELAPDATPFQIERAILSRVADSWLHQRSIFDARPNATLDEIVYAKENGWLGAFILTARPDLFVEERREWHAREPDAREAYAAWFRHTFEREPPGMRGGG